MAVFIYDSGFQVHSWACDRNLLRDQAGWRQPNTKTSFSCWHKRLGVNYLTPSLEFQIQFEMQPLPPVQRRETNQLVNNMPHSQETLWSFSKLGWGDFSSCSSIFFRFNSLQQNPTRVELSKIRPCKPETDQVIQADSLNINMTIKTPKISGGSW